MQIFSKKNQSTPRYDSQNLHRDRPRAPSKQVQDKVNGLNVQFERDPDNLSNNKETPSIIRLDKSKQRRGKAKMAASLL